MHTKKHLTLSVILYVLIAFLFLYHSFKLYSIHLGQDFMSSESFLNSFTTESKARIMVIAQSFFRVIILVSLVLIVRNKKTGIIGMWLGIGLLVLSQFWMVNESTNELVHSMLSGLKPLKGLLLPTLITVLYIKRK